MSGHHLATVRRAGRKRGARFESSEALAEQPAVARSAVELHGCCARVSLAEALLSQHIDGVARASSAGTKSRSSQRALLGLSLVLLTIYHWRPSREPHGWRIYFTAIPQRVGLPVLFSFGSNEL